MARQRKTRQETIKALQEKLAIMEAQEEAKNGGGEFIVQDDPTGELTVSRALKKRQTALKNAMEIIDGRDAEKDENGNTKRPKLNPIDVKIANKERQLEQLYEERDRVRRQEATLPHDIQRLQALLDSLEAEEVEQIELPDDLHSINGDAPDAEESQNETSDDVESALD